MVIIAVSCGPLQTVSDIVCEYEHVLHAKQMVLPHLSTPYTDFRFPEAEPCLMPLNILHPLNHLIKIYLAP